MQLPRAASELSPPVDPAGPFAAGRARRRRFAAYAALGGGSTGCVRAAVCLDDGRRVALKSCRRVHALGWAPFAPEDGEAARARFEAVAALDHPHLCRVFERIETEHKIYTVMELCESDLQAYLDAHGPLPEHRIRPILRSILWALAYLHSRGIAHRDLKPSNVLLRRPDEDPSDLALADFDAAGIVRGSPYGCEVDIWALGCMAVELATGRTPFEGAGSFHELYAAIGAGRWAGLPDGFSSGFRDLVARMLVVDQRERVTAAGALAHPWFWDPREVRMGREGWAGAWVAFDERTGELSAPHGDPSAPDADFSPEKWVCLFPAATPPFRPLLPDEEAGEAGGDPAAEFRGAHPVTFETMLADFDDPVLRMFAFLGASRSASFLGWRSAAQVGLCYCMMLAFQGLSWSWNDGLFGTKQMVAGVVSATALGFFAIGLVAVAMPSVPKVLDFAAPAVLCRWLQLTRKEEGPKPGPWCKVREMQDQTLLSNSVFVIMFPLIVITIIVNVGVGSCIPAWLLFCLSIVLVYMLINAINLASRNNLISVVASAYHDARRDLRTACLKLGPTPLAAALEQHDRVIGSFLEVSRYSAKILGFTVTYGGVRTMVVTMVTLSVALWSVFRSLGVFFTMESFCPLVD
ncbi:kinase-like domain-containing protein [Hyaloraphidium curvatum]|nr:kinase-like domain-containing protein [Hyaloraphidium curvatum]